MSNAWGLTLVAIGAIFAFAVTGHPSWVNLHIFGWVIMVTGIVGMILKRIDTGRFPRWLIIWRPKQPAQPAGGGGQQAAIAGTVINDEPVAGSETPPPTAPAPGETPGGMPPSAAAPGEPTQGPYEG